MYVCVPIYGSHTSTPLFPPRPPLRIPALPQCNNILTTQRLVHFIQFTKRIPSNIFQNPFSLLFPMFPNNSCTAEGLIKKPLSKLLFHNVSIPPTRSFVCCENKILVFEFMLYFASLNCEAWWEEKLFLCIMNIEL